MWTRLAGCILVLNLVPPISCHAQEPLKYDLFQLRGDDLYWQNTYDYSGPEGDLRPQIVQMLKSKFFTFNVVRNELGYTGEIRHYAVDCKRYGRTYLNTPRMYWEGEWTGKFIVELKGGNYAVSVYALYYEKMDQTVVGYYRTQQPVKGRYIDAVTRKNRKEFRKGEYSNMDLMSLSLKDNFDIGQNPVVQEKR